MKWTRREATGVSTYDARFDAWKFTVDRPYRDWWILRGWGPDGEFAYRKYRTLKAAKDGAVLVAGGVA